MRALLLLVLLGSLPACFLLDEEKAAPGCGDGTLDPGEECDEGKRNADTTDSPCLANCTLRVCGNAVTDPGEECDDGTNEETGHCPRCRVARCGDGFRLRDDLDAPYSGEGCDGEADCPPSCLLGVHCGDAVEVEGVEQCDLGSFNGLANSPCTSRCSDVRCGDGVVSAGEACDGGLDCEHCGFREPCAVVAAAAGIHSTLVVLQNGEVVGCGENTETISKRNPLPTEGPTADLLAPERLPLLPAALAAASPGDRIVELRIAKGMGVARSHKGKVFTWGRNDFGSRGVGTVGDLPGVSFVDMGDDDDLAFRSISIVNATVIGVTIKGKLFGWGTSYPKLFGSDPPAELVTCEFRGWPCVASPVLLSLGDASRRWTRVESTVGNFLGTAVEPTDGLEHLYAWGYNDWGQCGRPESAGENATCFSMSDPNGWSNDVDMVDDPIEVRGFHLPARAFAAGRYHSLIVDESGRLFGLGQNCFLQITGTRVVDADTPECAEAKLCGVPELRSATPVLFSEEDGVEPSFVASAASYATASWALDERGRLFAWGAASSGVLGPWAGGASLVDNRAAAPITLPQNALIRSIHAGNDHVLLVDDRGRLFGLGDDSRGQLCGFGGHRSFNDVPVEIKLCESP